MGVSREKAITILNDLKVNRSGLYDFTDAIEHEVYTNRNDAIDLAISDMKKVEELEVEKSLFTDNIYTENIVIPDGAPINTSLSPEEVKAIADVMSDIESIHKEHWTEVKEFEKRNNAKIILNSIKSNSTDSYVIKSIDFAIADMEKVEELEEKTLDILTDKQNIETDYAVFMNDYNELKAAKERDEAIIERLTASIASKRMLIDGLLGENKRLKDALENIKVDVKNKGCLDNFNVDAVLEIIDRYMREC